HMILMDSHLPGMDGPVATRLLRQTGFRRPIIAFTAGDEQEVDGLLKAGCDGVLHKPIKDTQLVSLLQKHLAPLDESAQPEPVEDEDDAIRELVTQFLDGLPERQQLMSNALQLQDWDTLRSQAHQIKGTAGAMGYPLMTEQAGRLERALKQGRVEEAQEQLRVLQQQISEALARRARAAGAAS
ncbi:MAG: Hpt domain-containing protein, partial [Gammaproteobacteria bacterium]|nr:Hpt domain-containing protein [Gammaproteobacteria bacterium]